MNTLLYTISIMGILQATAMAFGDGVHYYRSAFIGLIMMLFFQFLINQNIMKIRIMHSNVRFYAIRLIVLLFYGIIPVSLSYYYQSHEFNFAVILSGFAPGFAGIIGYSIYEIKLTRKSQATNSDIRNCLSIVYATLGMLLTPVVMYMYIRDHVLILGTTFLALLAIYPIVRITHNVNYDLKKMILMNQIFIPLYLIIFSIGWIF